MASGLEMVIRRGIVIVAVALSVGMAWVIHTRMAASEESRDANFFENASAISGAFRKALGPHPPVIELVIEPDNAVAQVVVGATSTQEFTLSQSSGFVSQGPTDAFPERDDVAFSMSTVPLDAVPTLVGTGREELGAPAARLIIDREPGAKTLRYRVVADDGREHVVTSPK